MRGAGSARAWQQRQPSRSQQEPPARPQLRTGRFDRPGNAVRDPRLGIAALSRVVGCDGEQLVRLVGLSAKTVQLITPRTLGYAGQCVDLFLPVVGGRELLVSAGIAAVDRHGDDERVTLELIIADSTVRRELNELLALLLAGDRDQARLQPRVVYDVAVEVRTPLPGRAHLEEITLSGLSMRSAERLAYGAAVSVTVPSFRSGPDLRLSGRVDGQQLSPESGYRTAVSFDPLDRERWKALGALIADLMCR